MSTKIFAPLRKVDIEKQTVVGVVAAEEPDRAGEVMDYESTKPFFEAWSDSVLKLTQGKSRGALREMHAESPVGKVVDIVFDDVGKKIIVTAKIVDAVAWRKVVEGVYTGFSQGGRYVRKWKDAATGLMRFTAEPREISLVDLPCLPGATFEITKGGAFVELRKFQQGPTDAERRRAELMKAAQAEVSAKYGHLDVMANEILSGLDRILKASPEYQKRVARCGTIDDEPEVAKAMLRAGSGKDVEALAAAEAERLSKMSPEEKAFEMTKTALRNPTYIYSPIKDDQKK